MGRLLHQTRFFKFLKGAHSVLFPCGWSTSGCRKPYSVQEAQTYDTEEEEEDIIDLKLRRQVP